MGIKRQVTVYEDSLDGKEIQEADVFKINLTVGRTSWELPLSEKNAEKFNDEIKKWTEREEPLSKQTFTATRKSPATTKPRTDPNQTKAIREWLKDTNYQYKGKPISDRGRIPAEALEAYEAAH